MTCPTCAERRRKLLEAWQNRQIAEAVRQAALGAAEMVGVKRKGGGEKPHPNLIRNRSPHVNLLP